MAVKGRISAAVSILGLVLGTGGLSLSMASSASANPVTNVFGCSFEQSSTLWTLQSNCSNTQEINLPAGVSLDGNDFTISPNFSKNTANGNATIGIASSNNVAIQDLVIDGTNGVNLHGMNIYKSTGVTIDHVALRNVSRIGINVNGSVVTVGNVTTSNSGWNGIDVDQGGGVTSPAILNIVGPMAQVENAFQILVDDTRKSVTVNDPNHQYAVMYFTKDGAPAAAYVLYRTGKQSCKDGGWNLGLNSTQSFKNQGQCVAFFAGGDKKSHSDESGDKSKSTNEND
jgi:hypothetical protein